jgi:hypothetical protein
MLGDASRDILRVLSIGILLEFGVDGILEFGGEECGGNFDGWILFGKPLLEGGKPIGSGCFHLVVGNSVAIRSDTVKRAGFFGLIHVGIYLLR